MTWLVAALAAAILSAVLTGRALGYLKRRRLLDHPNERSSHTSPTPRGGGLGMVPAVLLVWAALPGNAWAGIAGALVLMLASWIDDRRNLPPLPRLVAHAAVVGGALFALPDGLVFGGRLPLWADHALAGLGWLWFVNLFNFMDGIDGISGVETASLGVGIAVVAALAGASGLVPPAAALAGAAVGFLVWNWHPAKVFLGDVGSVPLGFLLGGLLIRLALAGQLAAALILPLYHVADATITIGRRALKGEKVWQPHRQHFYQRAVQGGRRHDQVALAVLAGNLALIAAAAVAAGGRPAEGWLMAVVAVALLLGLLARWAKGAPA